MLTARTPTACVNNPSIFPSWKCINARPQAGLKNIDVPKVKIKYLDDTHTLRYAMQPTFRKWWTKDSPVSYTSILHWSQTVVSFTLRNISILVSDIYCLISGWILGWILGFNIEFQYWVVLWVEYRVQYYVEYCVQYCVIYWVKYSGFNIWYNIGFDIGIQYWVQY